MRKNILSLCFLFSFSLLLIPMHGFSQDCHTNRLDQNRNQNTTEMQGLNDCFHEFLRKQAQIQIIQYRVRRVDSLLSGRHSHKVGTIILKKDNSDTTNVLSFYGKRDDYSFEEFYVDHTLYIVHNEKKFYFLKEDYGNIIFGSACGPLILTDLLEIDTSEAKYTLSNIDQDNFYFQTLTNNGSSRCIKQVIISKSTLTPRRIIIRKTSSDKSWNQTTDFILSEVRINEQGAENTLSNLYFKTAYGMFRDVNKRTADSLIGKKVADITLHTFKNGSINIRNLETKLVLLDFWELWCSPCKKSLPKVDSLANAYKSFGLTTFGIISDTLNVSAYLKEKNIAINQVKGNSDLNAIFMVNSYPRYVLIDRKGVIRSIYYGFSESMELDINRLLF